MRIEYSPAQQELRQKLKVYFKSLITPDVREQVRNNEGGGLSGEIYKKLIKQMAQDKWLAVGWPKEFGGQGFGPVEQLIFFEEARLAGAPLPFVTLNTVGPALMDHGTKEHKARFLPGIANGDIHFAIGYSEPGAGTDLAALKTAAVRDGDGWVINGNKVYTSGAEGADYIWLAARTDPEAPRHKGISIFIIDTKSEGFSFSPIHTVGGVRTNVTYYENVRVSDDMLVGELNGGWKLITSQLNHERIGLAAFSIYGVDLYERTLDWARARRTGEGRLIEQPHVQANLAEVHCLLEALKMLNLRMAASLDGGLPDPALSSAVKVCGSEWMVRICRLLMEVVGPEALIVRDSIGAALNGDLEQEYRACQITTFGGGVNEVLRDMIAGTLN